MLPDGGAQTCAAAFLGAMSFRSRSSLPSWRREWAGSQLDGKERARQACRRGAIRLQQRRPGLDAKASGERLPHRMPAALLASRHWSLSEQRLPCIKTSMYPIYTLSVIPHGAGSVEWRISVSPFTLANLLIDLAGLLLIGLVSREVIWMPGRLGAGGVQGATPGAGGAQAGGARGVVATACFLFCIAPEPTVHSSSSPAARPLPGSRLAPGAAAGLGLCRLLRTATHHAGGAARVARLCAAAGRAADHQTAVRAVERLALPAAAPAAGHHHPRGKRRGPPAAVRSAFVLSCTAARSWCVGSPVWPCAGQPAARGGLPGCFAKQRVCASLSCASPHPLPACACRS